MYNIPDSLKGVLAIYEQERLETGVPQAKLTAARLYDAKEGQVFYSMEHEQSAYVTWRQSHRVVDSVDGNLDRGLGVLRTKGVSIETLGSVYALAADAVRDLALQHLSHKAAPEIVRGEYFGDSGILYLKRYKAPSATILMHVATTTPDQTLRTDNVNVQWYFLRHNQADLTLLGYRYRVPGLETNPLGGVVVKLR